MSVKPLNFLYAGSRCGTFTYLPSSVLADALSVSPSAWFQKSAPAFRYSCSPIRSSPKATPFEVTEPVAPSDFRRMSSLYVRPLVTTFPERRTASAEAAAARVFDRIVPAGSLPTPLVPASGSPPLHPASSPVPVTARAHIAPSSVLRRVRPWEIAVTEGAAFRSWDVSGTGSVPGSRKPGGSSPSGPPTRADPIGTG